MVLWHGRVAGKAKGRRGVEHRRNTRGARGWQRSFGPVVTLLENRALLTVQTVTLLTESTNMLTYGQTEKFTATVETLPLSSTVPTGGTVTFYDGPATLDSADLGPGGTVSFTTPDLPAGVATITAAYSGATGFGPSATPLSPVAVINTVAGGGNGDGGLATATSLNSPYGVVIDSQGDIYIAESAQNEVREVNAITGVITTVAGTGVAGYSGDGGSATAAELNDPTGLAIDGSGDLFIADTGNNVVREVSAATGDITTVAGDGTAGYAGNGGSATGAELNGPQGVAVDSMGNLYIADTGNSVIREVSGGNITTIAGDYNLGAGYNGDNSTATAAQLDYPTDVAIGAGGLFIADTGNNLVREVSGAPSPRLPATTPSGQVIPAMAAPRRPRSSTCPRRWPSTPRAICSSPTASTAGCAR